MCVFILVTRVVVIVECYITQELLGVLFTHALLSINIHNKRGEDPRALLIF